MFYLLPVSLNLLCFSVITTKSPFEAVCCCYVKLMAIFATVGPNYQFSLKLLYKLTPSPGQNNKL